MAALLDAFTPPNCLALLINPCGIAERNMTKNRYLSITAAATKQQRGMLILVGVLMPGVLRHHAVSHVSCTLTGI